MENTRERHYTLRHYITRLILLCTLPLLLLLLVIASLHVATVQREQQRNAEQLAANIASIVDNDLKTRIKSLQAMALSPMALDPARHADFYTEAVGYRDSFGGQVILADPGSQMLFNTRVPLGTPLPLLPVPDGHAAAPEVLATGQPSVGDSFIGPIANTLLVAAVVPVLRDGQVRALLLSIVSASFIQGLVDTVTVPSGWHVRVVDGKGDRMASRGPVHADDEATDFERRFEVSSSLSQWRIVLDIGNELYNRPMRIAGIALAAGIVAALAIGLFAGWYSGQGLARAVDTLVEGDGGEAPAIVEILQAKQRLREAADARDDAVDRQLLSESMLRTSLESMPDEAVIIDTEGYCTFANRVFTRRYCTDRSADCAKKQLSCRAPDQLSEGYTVGRSDGSSWTAASDPLMRALAGEVVTGVEEQLTRHSDGEIFFREASCSPIRDADGAITGAVAIYRDITGRKRNEREILSLNNELELRVATRTRQLEEANRELEAFTYTVSHDLKAPLRGIDGYSRLLEEDCIDSLGGEARQFIGNIRQGVGRMNDLIEDLLVYSRLERRALQRRRLDLDVLVQGAVAEREEELDEHGVTLQVSVPALPVLGDFDGLMIAVRNLLDNAIKFSRRRPEPRIEIGGEARGELVRLWIRDNGVGFDPKHAELIFRIFQRLEPDEDYPGTGIGLALVEKVTSQHGGRVWADGVPGGGATFTIELPAWRET